jgi:hypothetical protein
MKPTKGRVVYFNAYTGGEYVAIIASVNDDGTVNLAPIAPTGDRMRRIPRVAEGTVMGTWKWPPVPPPPVPQFTPDEVLFLKSLFADRR